MKKFLSIIILLFGVFTAIAQNIVVTTNYVVNVDSISHAPDRPIPFDQSFKMVLKPRNPSSIVKVFAYPTLVDALGRPTITKLPNFIITPIVTGIPQLMGQSLVINFPALPPNYHFDFCLVRKLDTAIMDTFLTYANFIAKTRLTRGSTSNLEQRKADSNYFTFIKKIKNNPTTYNTTTTYIYDYLFEFNCRIKRYADCRTRSLEDIITSTMSSHYLSIINLNAVIAPYPTPPPPVPRSAVTIAPPSLLSDAKVTMPILLASPSKFNGASLNYLYRVVNNGGLLNLLIGRLSLNANYQAQPTPLEDIKQRFNNLKTSYKQLAGLQDTVERLANENGNVSIKRLSDYLKNIVNALNNSKTTVGSEYNYIRNYFSTNSQFYYTEWYINNTDSYADLQSKSSSIFSPQLGLAFLAVSSNNGGNQLIPKLAIGININFRSINKSLVRADIPDKGLAHYLSGFVGLTFGAFHDTQYTNLFASNTLLFGLNYRVTRSFYWSLGGVAFRQQNKNPIINDNHAAFGLSTSLMLDIDIVNSVSSFTGQIFK